MFVPILHERMVVSAWPWVSIALVAACLLVFPFTTWSPAGAESDRKFVEAVSFALTHPETEPDPRLLTSELADQLRRPFAPLETEADETARPAASDVAPEPVAATAAEESERPFDPEALTPSEQVAVEQEELDRLTAEWIASTESAPHWRYGLVPARLRPAALVTHQFLHGDLFHLLGNLLMLYLTAPLVEDRIGRGRFAAAYLGLGVFAGLAYALLFPGLYRPLIGASGAISAVVGMFVVLYAGLRLKYLLWIGLPLGVFAAPAWMMFPVWFVMQLVLGLQSSPSTEAGLGGVAYWAHAWGFAGGVAAGFALRGSATAIEIAAPDPRLQVQRLVSQGRRDEAWQLLRKEVNGGDLSESTIRELWNLGRLTGRSVEAAPAFGRLVRQALAGGEPRDVYRAAELWQELKAALRVRPVDPALSLAVAEAFVRLDESRELREEMIADALAGLAPTTAVPTVAALARLAAAARARDVHEALAAARARADLPETVRAALDAIADG